MTIMQMQVLIEMPREGIKESSALLQSEVGRQTSRAWLSELEGAQWQARLRYEGREQAASSDMQGESEQRNDLSSVQNGMRSLESAPVQQKDAMNTHESRWRSASESRQLQLFPGGQKDMVSIAPGIAPGIAQYPAGMARNAIIEANSLSMGPLPRSINPLNEWERAVTHPIVTEGKLTLFVRDNQLSDGDIRDLLFQLRDKCAKWGLELALLVVNGKLRFAGKAGLPE